MSAPTPQHWTWRRPSTSPDEEQGKTVNKTGKHHPLICLCQNSKGREELVGGTWETLCWVRGARHKKSSTARLSAYDVFRTGKSHGDRMQIGGGQELGVGGWGGGGGGGELLKGVGIPPGVIQTFWNYNRQRCLQCHVIDVLNAAELSTTKGALCYGNCTWKKIILKNKRGNLAL